MKEQKPTHEHPPQTSLNPFPEPSLVVAQMFLVVNLDETDLAEARTDLVTEPILERGAVTRFGIADAVNG